MSVRSWKAKLSSDEVAALSNVMSKDYILSLAYSYLHKKYLKLSSYFIGNKNP
jgi:hypothetical protein